MEQHKESTVVFNGNNTKNLRTKSVLPRSLLESTPVKNEESPLDGEEMHT